jgi:hypothetical protein
MRPALVFIRAHQIDGHQFFHGDELPPGLLPPETINQWLDNKWLAEHDASERRGLYRLFSPFSGCKEQEQFAKEELRQFALW